MYSALKIKIKDNENNINYKSGSIFHGVIMEIISSEVAEYLHKEPINPYSQFIMVGEDILWNIKGMNKFALDKILKPISEKKKIYLKNKDLELIFEDLQLQKISREDFISNKLFQNTKKSFKLKFLTPTSFKSNDRYIIIPNTRLIFQSLINKFDASGKEEVFSYKLLEDLINYSYISRYKLRSILFNIEKTKIPSFIGEIEIKINGPRELANIANLLICSGTYSGIGIKTAMGMGAIEIKD